MQTRPIKPMTVVSSDGAAEKRGEHAATVCVTVRQGGSGTVSCERLMSRSWSRVEEPRR